MEDHQERKEHHLSDKHTKREGEVVEDDSC